MTGTTTTTLSRALLRDAMHHKRGRRRPRKAKRTMIKHRTAALVRGQPATEALEAAFCKLSCSRHSREPHSCSSSSSIPIASTTNISPSSTMDMSSIFQEMAAIELETFRFPAIDWRFEENDDSSEDFSLSFANISNDSQKVYPEKGDDMDKVKMRKISESLLRVSSFPSSKQLRLSGMDTGNERRSSGLVRSGGLYSNLYMLGAGADSLSAMAPAATRSR